MFTGILLGLLAGTLQYGALSFSSRFLRESGRGMFWLLAPAFAVASAPAAVLFALFTGADAPPVREYAGSALLSVFFLLAGNAAALCMLKTVDASRISPLLAVKVPLLALFSFFVLRETYTPWQWAGVALVLPAAWLLCKAGKSIPAVALAWVVAGSALYGAADYCILLVLDAFKPCGGVLRPSMLAFCAVFIAGGMVGGVAMLCGLAPAREHYARSIVPYTAFWFFSLMALFASFALLGIVNGNIVQSVRGLTAIGLGWCVARAGFTKLEEHATPAVVLRRVVAGVLTVLAVLLFNLFKQQ